MIKKWIGIVLLALSTELSSVEFESTTFEARVSAFVPVSHRFRGIYGNVMPSYGAEVNTFFNGGRALWLNFDWLSKSGSSIGCGGNDTKVKFAVLSLGYKKMIPLPFAQFYWGLGGVLSEINVKNRRDAFREKVSRFSPGLVLKSGFYIPIQRTYFANFFADYYVQPGVFKTSVDVGGLRAGVGAGVQF